MSRLHLDLESRGTVDLTRVGVYVYANHPDTEVLLARYCIDDGPIHGWRKGELIPPDLKAAIDDPDTTLVAHNAMFEWHMIEYNLVPREGWPGKPTEQLDCTAARAAIQSLPRNLAGAARALGLPIEKDDEGRRLMLQMCKPRKPRKDEDPEGVYWFEDSERMDRLDKYCEKDVEVERELDNTLQPMSAREKKIWLLDFRINVRGVAVDIELVREADKVLARAIRDLSAELKELTDGDVTTVNQLDRLKAWLVERMPDVAELESLDKQALADLLQRDDLDPTVRRVLEVRREAAKSSTAKLKAFMERTSDDGRMRENLMYHGAGTGRWSGRGVQCVTGDHEVLTPDGWVPIGLVSGRSTTIMQWAPGQGMSFALCPVQSYGPAGKLAYIDAPAIKGAFTMDHRLPVFRAENVGDFAKVIDWTPEDLLSVKRRNGFVVSDSVDQPEADLTDAQIQLRVAFQADGFWQKRAVAWRFSKDRKIARLKRLLDEAGLRYKETQQKPNVTKIRIATADVPGWLQKPFGAWIMALSARQARLLLDETAEWDGFRHGVNGAVQLMSPERDQVEWLATAAALAGSSSTVEWYATTKSDRGRWCFYERSSRSTTIAQEMVSVVDSDDEVFCPTTPDGYWLCRYGGRVFITGNCQNLPRPELSQPQIEHAIPVIKDTSMAVADRVRLLDFLYGGVPTVVSDCLRGCITGGPDGELAVADYSNIEGRVNAWAAGQNDKVEMFRRGEGIYERMAAAIYGINDPSTIAKDSPERHLGKTAELGCGFGAGWRKFITMCATAGITIDEEMAQHTVDTFRQVNNRIKQLWYGLEDAAVEAMRLPGELTDCNGVGFYQTPDRSFLLMILPSGRKLYYPHPLLRKTETPWGAEKDQISYMGMNAYTNRWEREHTYGAKICENLCQSVARDLMAFSMYRAEQRGFPIVLTVHDELVAEIPACQDDTERKERLDELRRIMCELPKWAGGLPIAAEGYVGWRFRK